MGDSGGGLDVGVPLVMLPPEAELREVPVGHKASERGVQCEESAQTAD